MVPLCVCWGRLCGPDGFQGGGPGDDFVEGFGEGIFVVGAGRERTVGGVVDQG